MVWGNTIKNFFRALFRFLGLLVLISAILVTILWAQAAQNNPNVSLSIMTLIPTAIVPPGSEGLLAQFNNGEEQPRVTPIPSLTPDGFVVQALTEDVPPIKNPQIVKESEEFLLFPTPTVIPQPEIALEDYLTLAPDSTEVYTPADRIEMPNGITNVLLIGIDSAGGADETSVRTDSLIIVSVNKNFGSASIMSIPRDLFLYIPGSRRGRINTAYAYGNSTDYPGGGVKLLKDTILFNFGIPIHYYAKIDFDGFEEIVDSIGGIEIVNSCALTDWILKEPGLDIQEEDNYERFTLDPGVHEMDGFMALWYARSRSTTSDFDRGRRQQQILDAVLDRSIDLDLVVQVPSMWKAFQDTIETDMDLGRMLQLATLANTIQENGVQHLYLTRGELESATLEASGAEVQVLVPDNARRTFEKLYKIPALNNSSRKPVTFEIINGTGDPDMGRIAQENLHWFGFQTVLTEANGPIIETTTIDYHGQNFKGSYSWLVAWMFRQYESQINLNSDPEQSYDYKAVLGEDYNPCRNPLYAPGG